LDIRHIPDIEHLMKGRQYTVSAPTPARMLRQAGQQRVMLDRALSKLGVCSRVQAQELIRAGRVRVNNKIVRAHTFWIALPHDTISLDGQVVQKVQQRIYLMLHKPPGYVTSRRDNLERKSVFALLPGPFRAMASSSAHSRLASHWIFPVGRLDMDSEGLLLFTNDGELGDALLAPLHHVPKTYRVCLDRLPTREETRYLAGGLPLDGKITLPAQIHFEPAVADQPAAQNQARPARREIWLRMIIQEGKNRQIRRMFAAVQCEVLQLIRVSFGPLQLEGLPPGEWRYLAQSEVRALHKAVAA